MKNVMDMRLDDEDPIPQQPAPAPAPSTAPMQMPPLMGGLTPGTSQQTAPTALPPPSQTINQDGKQYNFTPGANGSLTAKAPPGQPMNLTPPPPQAKMLPGMPIGADELGQYLASQKRSMSLYGPDQQMALQQQTLKDRNSFGNQLTSGLKGFSDALMQGVAGAGNPGNQQAFENQQDQRAREQMDTLRNAHQEQLQDTESGMKMDMMDPNTPVSKAYRESFGPIFAKMGYSPKDVAKMSASQVGTVADLGVRFADAQTQLALKEAMLGVEKFKAQAGVQNAELENKMNAAKTLEGRGLFRRAVDMITPTGRASTKLLENTMNGTDDSFEPDVVAYSQKHGITPEQAQRIKEQRTSS